MCNSQILRKETISQNHCTRTLISRGIIDGTHVQIMKPHTKILFPKVHDSSIWEVSRMKATLARRSPEHFQHLIGDEGFASSETLLTIVRSAEVDEITDPAFLLQVKSYNKALNTARVRIEHGFGLLEKRFPALLYQLQCIKISNVQAIICSCIILHNFLLKCSDSIPNISEDESQRQIAEMREDNISNIRTGQLRKRNNIIHTFF